MDRQEELVIGFRELYNKMVWLNRMEMEERLKGYKPSEIHCVEYIGKNDDANVTKLAEAFYMTRGAISKLSKKLMEKGLIRSYQKPDNKKEIYFALTLQGEKLYEIHEALHETFRQRDRGVFDRMSREQLEAVFEFVSVYNQHLEDEIDHFRREGKSK